MFCSSLESNSHCLAWFVTALFPMCRNEEWVSINLNVKTPIQMSGEFHITGYFEFWTQIPQPTRLAKNLSMSLFSCQRTVPEHQAQTEGTCSSARATQRHETSLVISEFKVPLGSFKEYFLWKTFKKVVQPKVMVFQCFVVMFAYFVEIRKFGIIPLFTLLRRKIVQNIFVGA